MNRRSLCATTLAMALALSMPAMGLAQGHGNHGGGNGGDRQESRSKGNRGGDRGNRGRSAERVERWRGGAPGSGTTRTYERRDVTVTPRAWNRPDIRVRDRSTPTRTYVRNDVRYKGGYSGYSAPRYRTSGTYFTTRTYYVGSFYRPRYYYRPGITLGISVAMSPRYGYRYYDPYCGISFRYLGDYYDHCYDYDHPTAILMMDTARDVPVAMCGYRSGSWVVVDYYH